EARPARVEHRAEFLLRISAADAVAVAGQRVAAAQLGGLALGAAAEEVHLPEAVLAFEPALRPEGRVRRLGEDMGDAPGVAEDADLLRSEERRVGKECRSRWS